MVFKVIDVNSMPYFGIGEVKVVNTDNSIRTITIFLIPHTY